MLSIVPVAKALTPVDSQAAQRLIGPNYDEFQSDLEIWQFLQENPDSILKVTMAHCDVASQDEIGKEGSPEALTASAYSLSQTIASPLCKTVDNVLWVYEIVDPKRNGIRQMGLGGSAKTAEIKTEENPDGTIIRNEGIRPAKAAGRAKLISQTNSYIGIVNNTVEDQDGSFAALLEQYADSRSEDFAADDEHGNRHRVWLVSKTDEIEQFQAALTAQGAAYVADGNHRSAAAAQLGHEEFLAVFFPAPRMGLAPYNRLIDVQAIPEEELIEKLSTNFEVEKLGDLSSFAPDQIHVTGLYYANTWLKLTIRPEILEQADAAGRIDAALLQKYVFSEIFGIEDATDSRLNYVGGNKDSAYLKQQVDTGSYTYAMSLAPVTMNQFIDVCRAQQFMPPKSTWFEPKVRSGLVVALLPTSPLATS